MKVYMQWVAQQLFKCAKVSAKHPDQKAEVTDLQVFNNSIAGTVALTRIYQNTDWREVQGDEAVIMFLLAAKFLISEEEEKDAKTN